MNKGQFRQLIFLPGIIQCKWSKMSPQQTQTESSVPAIVRFTMGLPKPTRHLESRHPCTVQQAPKYIVTIHVTVYSVAVTQDC